MTHYHDYCIGIILHTAAIWNSLKSTAFGSELLHSKNNDSVRQATLFFFISSTCMAVVVLKP